MLNQLYFERQFSSKKALNELGWQASISFKSGIEQVIKEYMSSR
jgi:nucleoside-diphosphate-sugar epimerase